MNKNIKSISQIAIIAGLYVALTLLFHPISYGSIQFRISEILVLLVIFNPKYSIALIIGCLIANSFSTLGPIDVLFGGLATAIAVLIMGKIKNIYLSPLIAVIVNAILIAIELEILEMGEFIFNLVSVGLGEAIVLYIIGLPVMLILSRNAAMVELLELDTSCIKKNKH